VLPASPGRFRSARSIRPCRQSTYCIRSTARQSRSWSRVSSCGSHRCASISRRPVCYGERISLVAGRACRGYTRQGDHAPIELQFMVCHQARAFLRLQARAKGNFGVLLTKRDHVTEDGSTFVATDRSDKEEIGCQTVPLRYKAADAVELGAVVSHQDGVV